MFIHCLNFPESNTCYAPPSLIQLVWEPSDAQVTHNYSPHLPALCRKLWFKLFFPVKGDPMILESQNQAKNISMARVPQSKFEANLSEGSWVMIGQINKHPNRDSTNMANDSRWTLFVRNWVLATNSDLLQWNS